MLRGSQNTQLHTAALSNVLLVLVLFPWSASSGQEIQPLKDLPVSAGPVPEGEASWVITKDADVCLQCTDRKSVV